MAGEVGRIACSDRAATAAQPSQSSVVSGKAGIPCARPTRHDDAVIRAAAEKLAVDCVEWDGSSSADEWVEDLIKCKWDWEDGFKLAKALEDRCYLDADFDLAEILSGASSYLWNAHQDAVKAWIEANNISPPLAVGTRVTCSRGIGEITKIYEDRGQYVVLPDAERDDPKFKNGGGWLIDYDDAAQSPTQAEEMAK